MGVLACNRTGCDNIMCDYYSSEYGYICSECLNELRNKPLSLFKGDCKLVHVLIKDKQPYSYVVLQYMKGMSSNKELTLRAFKDDRLVYNEDWYK